MQRPQRAMPSLYLPIPIGNLLANLDFSIIKLI